MKKTKKTPRLRGLDSPEELPTTGLSPQLRGMQFRSGLVSPLGSPQRSPSDCADVPGDSSAGSWSLLPVLDLPPVVQAEERVVQEVILPPDSGAGDMDAESSASDSGSPRSMLDSLGGRVRCGDGGASEVTENVGSYDRKFAASPLDEMCSEQGGSEVAKQSPFALPLRPSSEDRGSGGWQRPSSEDRGGGSGPSATADMPGHLPGRQVHSLTSFLVQKDAPCCPPPYPPSPR